MRTRDTQPNRDPQCRMSAPEKFVHEIAMLRADWRPILRQEFPDGRL